MNPSELANLAANLKYKLLQPASTFLIIKLIQRHY
jgi:hypothetical protein